MAKKASKKATHGGKRAGAGRKPTNPEGNTITIAASVPKALVDEFDAVVTKPQGWSRSEAITLAIRHLITAYKCATSAGR